MIRAALLIVLLRIAYALLFTSGSFEDAYICFRVASNWLNTGHPDFNAGVHGVMSATSALWLFILTPIVALHGRSDPSFALLILNSLLDGITTALGLSLFAGRTGKVAWYAGWALTPFLARVPSFGLETGLLILAGFASVATTGRWRMAALATLAAVRPEGPIYAGVLALMLPGRRAALLSVLAGTVFQGGANIALWGHAIPDTVTSKALVHGVHWFKGTFWIDWLVPGMKVYCLGLAGLASIQIVALPGALSLLRWNDRRTALAAAGMAMMAAYFVMGTTLFDWYLAPAVAFVLPLLMSGADVAIGVVGRMLPGPYLRLALATVLLWMLLAAWPNATYQESRRVVAEERYRVIGQELGAKLDPTGTILLEPAGIIPWYTPNPIIDEVGLVTPWVAKLRHDTGDGWYWKILKDQKPKYLLGRARTFAYNQELGGIGHPFAFSQDAIDDSLLFYYRPVHQFMDSTEMNQNLNSLFVLLERKSGR